RFGTVHHVVGGGVSGEQAIRQRWQLTGKAGTGSVDDQVKPAGYVLETTAGYRSKIRKVPGQPRGLSRCTAGDVQACRGFSQQRPQCTTPRATCAEHQNAGTG